MTEPYKDTSVPVERSKEQVRKALRAAGARGLQMDELWAEDGQVTSCVVRFLWPTEQGVVVPVRFNATPLEPERGARGGWKVSPEQRERQAWRGLAWYVESMVKAATFGIVPFEAVFLAFFEDDSGKTIGEHLIPRLESGQFALPKGRS